MFKKTATVAAATIGLTMPLGGIALANPHNDDEGWYPVDQTYTSAKGEDCSGKVVEHYRSKERILVENKHGKFVPLPAEVGQEFDPATLEDGQSFIVDTKWGKVHWYAPKTGKHVRRDSSGDFKFTLADGGEDLVIHARGNNYFVGAGVKGILQVSGHQTAYVEDWAGDNVTTRLRVHGSREQICKTLGLQPIDDRVGHDDGGHDDHAERRVL